MADLPLTVPDLLFMDDLDPLGRETINDLQTLAQDVYHVLEQTMASNLDDPSRGLGAAGLLSGSVDALAAFPSLCDNELRKDSRIDASRTTLTTNADGSYSIDIQIQPSGAVLPQSFGFRFSSPGGLVPA